MQTGGAQPVEFSIPPQPLADALHAYQQQMRVQVLYEARAAAGRQSVAVVGKFLPDAALRRLLSGTDLEVVRAGPEAIALVSPRPQERDVPPVSPLETADLSLGELHVRAAASPSRSDQFQDYNESVRAEIERVLRKNVKTGSGNYRAVIDLWIDSARRVQKVALLGSTGETARDAAISAALRGLTINRPTPANAPQPLRVIVTVRTAQ
ncbi:energy transducer TonB [Rhodoblastus sphagnicola]|uniref:Energy transducer TonB n=1 Tax=Rhodoblastus sphagnicola TaxID=333368 RepID=A0A2S6NAW6_9HYPH|nr:energy transducer TonB [Rhodoblastus sphagnicola]